MASVTDEHAIQLNQNPAIGRGMRSPDTTYLHTIIRNNGLIKVRSLGRWFTGSELLLTQGFPVRQSLATPRSGILRRCCSFCPGSDGYGDVNVYKPAAWQRLADNAMNVSIPCVITLYLLVFTQRYDEACLLCKEGLPL